jgi:hypothetical protein
VQGESVCKPQDAISVREHHAPVELAADEIAHPVRKLFECDVSGAAGGQGRIRFARIQTTVMFVCARSRSVRAIFVTSGPHCRRPTGSSLTAIADPPPAVDAAALWESSHMH